MRAKSRNITVFAIVGIVAAYGHMWAWNWWFHVAVEGYSSVTTWEWLDIAHLKLWVFEVTWGIVIGAVVAAAVNSSRPALWAISGGLLSGAVHFSTSTNHFFPTTPLNTYFWAYGVYLMPVVGSAIGAALVMYMARRQQGQMHAV